MAFPVTASQLAMLMDSHEMSARCALFRGSQSLGDLPVISARVSATLRTQGGRDGVMEVPRSVLDSGLLNPLSDQVVLYTGVKGQFEVPIGTFRVDSVSDYSDGNARVVLLSRGAEAIRAQFEVPWAATNGTQTRQEMARILQDVDASWGVNYSAAANTIHAPNLVWEEDRGQALDQLAQGASLIWQPDRSGGFVIYDNPYAIGPVLGANPVVVLRDGVDGTTVSVNNASTRDGLYNSVTVVTERVDNTPPVRVTVKDTDPTSATFWGGLFGKQNLVVKNQTPIGLLEAQLLASRILRQSVALVKTFEVVTPHMPILDPGDVFALFYRNVVYTLVVESIAYSYDAQDETVIQARELRELDFVEMFT